MAHSDPSLLAGIPTLDIRAFIDGDEKEKSAFAAALGEAYETIGFAAIHGHGIPDNLISRLYSESEGFFALPAETKRRYARPEAKNQPYQQKLILEVKNNVTFRKSFFLLHSQEFRPQNPVSIPKFHVESEFRVQNVQFRRVTSKNRYLRPYIYFFVIGSSGFSSFLGLLPADLDQNVTG